MGNMMAQCGVCSVIHDPGPCPKFNGTDAAGCIPCSSCHGFRAPNYRCGCEGAVRVEMARRSPMIQRLSANVRRNVRDPFRQAIIMGGLGAILVTLWVMFAGFMGGCTPTRQDIEPDDMASFAPVDMYQGPPLCPRWAVTCERPDLGMAVTNPLNCVPSLCYCPNVPGARCCCADTFDMGPQTLIVPRTASQCDDDIDCKSPARCEGGHCVNGERLSAHSGGGRKCISDSQCPSGKCVTPPGVCAQKGEA